jgi:TM2 domain-containing membrane protein YozV
MKKIILLAVAAIFMVSSCTIEKRLYNSGYHVEWNHSKKHVDSDQVAQEENSSEVREVQTVVVNRTANADQVVEESIVNNDAVVTTDAETENILSHEVVSTTHAVSQESAASAVKDQQVKAVKAKESKKAAKSKAPAGGKSQLVALLLCIFVGVIGIHRFYLGYIGIGVLMLLTGGCCGILALIDLIRIITRRGSDGTKFGLNAQIVARGSCDGSDKRNGTMGTATGSASMSMLASPPR